ncbi:MAG: hypothetical protein NC821_06295 [Candidatus Omnitrophica bacterium]|nr:hypothetical protein [Candidatus Omnitrophota bacterium]
MNAELRSFKHSLKELDAQFRKKLILKSDYKKAVKEFNEKIEYLKKNGLGNQAENMRKEIESALKTNGVKVSSIESYTNGKQTRSDLMITGANLDYRVLAGYNEKGEVNFGEMSKQDNQNHQTYVLSVEKSQVFPGETKEEAAKRYFLKNFGITDPANHAQLKNVWTQIVNNWGNWTISSENTFTSTLEGRNGKVNLTFTYGGQKIQLSFDYTISGKKPGN